MSAFLVGSGGGRCARLLVLLVLPLLWIVAATTTTITITTTARGADAPIRQSTDKVAYPKPAGSRVLNKKMPLVGVMLGALPEEACNTGKIMSMSSDLEIVDKLRKRLAEQKIDFSDFDFVADGRAGATYTLLGLADGRVSKVGFFYPEITEVEANNKLLQFKRMPWDAPIPEGTPPERVPQWRVLTLDGTRVYSMLSGIHKRVFHPEHHATVGKKSGAAPPDQVFLEPSLITIGIDAADWYVLHHELSATAKEALHQKRLLVGMSRVDAYIALIDYRLGIADRQGDSTEHWTWYKDARRAPAWMAAESLYSVPVMRSVEKFPTVRCTATLEDGKIKEFRDR